MDNDDASLQELIVRALTGLDQRARQTLEAATCHDPALKQFCAELDQVVRTLAGSADWRAATPSPELVARVRNAVSEKLQSAPAHFRTVVLEADLGRRRLLLWLVLPFLAVLALLVAVILWFGLHGAASGSVWEFSGKTVFEGGWQAQNLQNWETLGEAEWQNSGGGLQAKGGEEPAVLFLRKGFEAGSALAFEVDLSVPGLDERSNVVLFLAEASVASRPAFDDRLRPQRALTFEIDRDGLVLLDPDGQLLHSPPTSNAEARFYRLRLEHLGSQVRVLLNGKVFFEGAMQQPLRGLLHPGVRLTGPLKNKVLLNKIRIER